MKRKIVILGSTGFIGSALLKEFHKHEEIAVQGYNSTELDLISLDCVEKLLEVVDAQTILIVTSRSRRDNDPFTTFANDIAIATNIGRFLSQRQIEKCVYFSSNAVYGDATTDLSVTEQTAIAPTSFYGLAKYTGEGIIKQVAEKARIPLVVLRPCMIYGPGDTSTAYGPARFIKSILSEGKVYLFGDGTEVRDYLYIDDLVKITIELALGDRSGIYNMATGKSYSFQEIIKYLRRVVKEEFEVINADRDRPKVDIRLNNVKILKELPQISFTEIEQGLRSAYNYFAKTGRKEL